MKVASFFQPLPMSISGRGALVVLEGCDRAGKSTQGRLLLERIRESGGECELLAFPGKADFCF